MTPAWPEKVIAFLLVFEIVFVMFFALTAPHAGSDAWFVAMFGIWRFPVFTLTPLWLLLRAFDAVTGGPARRSGIVIVRPLR